MLLWLLTDVFETWELLPLAAETLLAEINGHFLLHWSIFRVGDFAKIISLDLLEIAQMNYTPVCELE